MEGSETANNSSKLKECLEKSKELSMQQVNLIEELHKEIAAQEILFKEEQKKYEAKIQELQKIVKLAEENGKRISVEMKDLQQMCNKTMTKCQIYYEDKRMLHDEIDELELKCKNQTQDTNSKILRLENTLEGIINRSKQHENENTELRKKIVDREKLFQEKLQYEAKIKILESEVQIAFEALHRANIKNDELQRHSDIFFEEKHLLELENMKAKELFEAEKKQYEAKIMELQKVIQSLKENIKLMEIEDDESPKRLFHTFGTCQ